VKFQISILTVFILLLSSCATDFKRPPSGGPDDKTSPEVAFTSFADGSLNADKNTELEIVFSEYLSRNSTANAINISPRSAAKKSKVLWYDKSAEISFKGLDDNQTVVITLNPLLKDAQGNPLAGSYSLSFSTGDRIDQKYISGHITGAIDKRDILNLNYARIKINLYSVTADSLNPAKDEPEYSTGVSRDFFYELRNVSSGKYKILAFNDVNGDSKPQFDTELVSFSPSFLDLTAADSLNLNFALGRHDTDPPFIKNTSLAAQSVLKIDFSEDIKGSDSLIDSLFLNDVPVNFKEFRAGKVRNSVYAETVRPKIGDRLKMKLKQISDDFGNEARSAFLSKTHIVTDTPAVAPFRLSGRIPAKIAKDQVITFLNNQFSKDSISVRFMNMKDSIVHSADKGIAGFPFGFSMGVEESGMTEGDWELSLMLKDSVLVKSKLTVTEPSGYGSVSGRIENPVCKNTAIICRNVKDGEPAFEQTRENSFEIRLRPGKYILAAFGDCGTSGVFDMNLKNDVPGKALFFKDTVLVRKNWETTGINFDFNK
jgi:hypothetical protein